MRIGRRCRAPIDRVWRAFAVTWAYGDGAPDAVEVELRPLGGGEGDGAVEVVLVQRSTQPDAWRGLGPGWEDWMLRLSLFLDGGDVHPLSPEALEARTIPLWDAVQARTS